MPRSYRAAPVERLPGQVPASEALNRRAPAFQATPGGRHPPWAPRYEASVLEAMFNNKVWALDRV